MRRLAIDLLGVPILRWIVPLLSIAWLLFGVAICGRWLAASLELPGYSLLAVAVVVEPAGIPNEELFIPQLILGWARQYSSPLVVSLLLAFGTVVAGRAVETLVDWRWPWIQPRLYRTLTPDVTERTVGPAKRRPLDPPTAAPCSLLKFCISSFIFESPAATIGDLGSIIIVLFAIFKTNNAAGLVTVVFFLLLLAIRVHALITNYSWQCFSWRANGKQMNDGCSGVDARAEVVAPHWREKILIRLEIPEYIDLEALRTVMSCAE
jgi:hypothetical protein